MNAWMLLLLITLMYAGYNLFVKVSGDHAAGTVTTTILARSAYRRQPWSYR